MPKVFHVNMDIEAILAWIFGYLIYTRGKYSRRCLFWIIYIFEACFLKYSLLLLLNNSTSLKLLSTFLPSSSKCFNIQSETQTSVSKVATTGEENGIRTFIYRIKKR